MRFLISNTIVERDADEKLVPGPAKERRKGKEVSPNLESKPGRSETAKNEEESSAAQPVSGEGGDTGSGIMEFLTKLKSQEKEVEQKRKDTLRQLEKIKLEIQKSIREDRQERMHVMQNIDGHHPSPSYVPRRQQQQPPQPAQVPAGADYDLMSVTSGTSFSSNSLAQNSQFVAIHR